MRSIRLFKVALVMALILGIMVVGLFGNRSHALAQDSQHQTYVVQAGDFGPDYVELLSFEPNILKIHQGDTVTWHFASFHSVHFGEDKPADLVIVPIVNNQPIPQINPAAAFPTLKSGDTYSGGNATTGLPVDPTGPTSFSMVMDLPPGDYVYYCDAHPGMMGTIEVVADDVSIPTPGDVAAAASDDIASQVNPVFNGIDAIEAKNTDASSDGKLAINVGTGDTGRVSVEAFFSPVATVKVGDSITWTVPADSVEIHTVTSANFSGEDFNIMPQQSGPPIVGLGQVFAPTTQTSVGLKDLFTSGVLNPGQSYTLSFSEPGVYAYECRIHDGMKGIVLVEPKA